jgi:phosphopantetheinyl transferase
MIRWLLMADRSPQTLDGYLHPAEVEEGRRYRHPGRHHQFKLGRATAKNLLGERGPEMGLPALGPRGIWIHRTDAGWPQVRDGAGNPLPVSLTIAHTGSTALCAMCPEGEGRLGADMEPVAHRPQAFLEDFYTEAERAQLHNSPPSTKDRLATLFWVIKEAVLKARRTGLTENAKVVDVLAVDSSSEPDWRRAQVEMADGSQPEVYTRWEDEGQLAVAIARCEA